MALPHVVDSCRVGNRVMTVMGSLTVAGFVRRRCEKDLQTRLRMWSITQVSQSYCDFVRPVPGDNS
jgi:hypothetical protein